MLKWFGSRGTFFGQLTRISNFYNPGAAEAMLSLIPELYLDMQSQFSYPRENRSLSSSRQAFPLLFIAVGDATKIALRREGWTVLIAVTPRPGT